MMRPAVSYIICPFHKFFRHVKEELAIRSIFAYCKMKEVLLISKGAELIQGRATEFSKQEHRSQKFENYLIWRK